MKRLLTKISIIALLFANGLLVTPAGATGVTVSVSPSSSSSSPQVATVQWVRSVATTYTAGTTIVITSTPPMTDVTSTSMSIDIDGNGVNDTAYTTSTCNLVGCTMTLTVTVPTASVTTFSVTSTQFTFDGTAQNYSISVFTSAPVDFGAALFYANGGNQVAVSANVPATLSFAIRDSADTSNVNTCALGTLSTAAVSTCSYRLRIGTNAANGFTATIQANADFNSGGSATMTTITDNGAFSAGTESYGIQVLTAATEGGRDAGTGAYDQPVTEGTAVGYTFQTDASPVPTSSAPTILSYSGPFRLGAVPSTTSTSLVTHAAAINSATPAGNYSQTVTYLVTASY